MEYLYDKYYENIDHEHLILKHQLNPDEIREIEDTYFDEFVKELEKTKGKDYALRALRIKNSDTVPKVGSGKGIKDIKLLTKFVSPKILPSSLHDSAIVASRRIPSSPLSRMPLPFFKTPVKVNIPKETRKMNIAFNDPVKGFEMRKEQKHGQTIAKSSVIIPMYSLYGDQQRDDKNKEPALTGKSKAYILPGMPSNIPKGNDRILKHLIGSAIKDGKSGDETNKVQKLTEYAINIPPEPEIDLVEPSELEKPKEYDEPGIEPVMMGKAVYSEAPKEPMPEPLIRYSAEPQVAVPDYTIEKAVYSEAPKEPMPEPLIRYSAEPHAAVPKSEEPLIKHAPISPVIDKPRANIYDTQSSKTVSESNDGISTSVSRGGIPVIDDVDTDDDSRNVIERVLKNITESDSDKKLRVAIMFNMIFGIYKKWIFSFSPEGSWMLPYLSLLDKLYGDFSAECEDKMKAILTSYMNAVPMQVALPLLRSDQKSDSSDANIFIKYLIFIKTNGQKFTILDENNVINFIQMYDKNALDVRDLIDKIDKKCNTDICDRERRVRIWKEIVSLSGKDFDMHGYSTDELYQVRNRLRASLIH